MSEKLATAVREIESSETADEQQRVRQQTENAAKRQEKVERLARSKNQIINGAKHFGMTDELCAFYDVGRDQHLKAKGMRIPYHKSGETELVLIPKIIGSGTERSKSDDSRFGENSGLAVFGVAVNRQTGQESEASQIFAVWAKTYAEKEQVMVYDEDYQPAPHDPNSGRSHSEADMSRYYGGFRNAWQPMDVLDPARQEQLTEFEDMLGCIKGGIANTGEQQARANLDKELQYAETLRS